MTETVAGEERYRHDPALLPVTDVIPHRPPRLWLDGVSDLADYHNDVESGVSAWGFWRPDEAQFDGHFPDMPILQGVQQLESLAQLGCYVAMYEQPGKLGVLFAGAEVKFVKPVFPGDVLDLFVEVPRQDKKSVFRGVGTAAVNGEVTCQAVIEGRIVRREVYEKMLTSARELRNPAS